MTLCEIKVVKVILEIDFSYKQEFENNKRIENQPQKTKDLLRILVTRNRFFKATIKIFKILGAREIVFNAFKFSAVLAVE